MSEDDKSVVCASNMVTKLEHEEVKMDDHHENDLKGVSSLSHSERMSLYGGSHSRVRVPYTFFRSLMRVVRDQFGHTIDRGTSLICSCIDPGDL